MIYLFKQALYIYRSLAKCQNVKCEVRRYGFRRKFEFNSGIG